MGRDFRCIQQVIDKLNADGVNYLILRNYECLLDDQIYVGGHEDIDVLCESTAPVVNSLGAISNRAREDNTHYHIFVDGNRVNLDLRSVGDGYYCENWQKEMLQNKKFYNGFYVMSDEDYYYSLIYHAIFQKKYFTEEYRQRLAEMSQNLCKKKLAFDREHFVEDLCIYMRSKDYKFVYAEDPSIPLNFTGIDRSLIDVDLRRRCKCQYFQTKKFIILQLIELKRNIRKICKENTPPHIGWMKIVQINLKKLFYLVNMRNICYACG